MQWTDTTSKPCSEQHRLGFFGNLRAGLNVGSRYSTTIWYIIQLLKKSLKRTFFPLKTIFFPKEKKKSHHPRSVQCFYWSSELANFKSDRERGRNEMERKQNLIIPNLYQCKLQVKGNPLVIDLATCTVPHLKASVVSAGCNSRFITLQKHWHCSFILIYFHPRILFRSFLKKLVMVLHISYQTGAKW